MNTTGSDSGILFDEAGTGTDTTTNHDTFGNILFGDGHVAGLDLGGLKETANKFEQVLNRNGVVVE